MSSFLTNTFPAFSARGGGLYLYIYIYILLLLSRMQVYPRTNNIPPFLLASIIPVAIAISPLLFNSQNRNSRTSLVRRRGGPKLVQFRDPFLRGFGPQNGPQNCSKIGQQIDNFGVHFWIPFFEALELLGCLLGAFLGFLRLFWDASGPQKP